MYSGEAVGTITTWIVTAGDDTYTFDRYPDARDALVRITTAAVEGRPVWPCSWEVVRTDGYECDFPGDQYVPCGMPTFADPDDNGFACLAGHSHRSDVEYYDADEVAAARASGRTLAPNARLMDGSVIV